jgi:hypothetical protein
MTLQHQYKLILSDSTSTAATSIILVLMLKQSLSLCRITLTDDHHGDSLGQGPHSHFGRFMSTNLSEAGGGLPPEEAQAAALGLGSLLSGLHARIGALHA